MTTLTFEEWSTKGVKLFGEDRNKWKFKCPVCGYVQGAEDYGRAGAPVGSVGFSCVGRWVEGSREAFGGKGPGPCNYAGGGLFKVNPVTVKTPGGDVSVFDFAEVGGTEQNTPSEGASRTNAETLPPKSKRERMIVRAVDYRLDAYVEEVRKATKEGRQTVTSNFLADALGADPTLVRKDMAVLGVVGKPRIGYDVENLRRALVDRATLHNSTHSLEYLETVYLAHIESLRTICSKLENAPGPTTQYFLAEIVDEILRIGKQLWEKSTMERVKRELAE